MCSAKVTSEANANIWSSDFGLSMVLYCNYCWYLIAS